MTRDAQRERLYGAEQAIRLPRGSRAEAEFETLDKVQAFIDEVQQSRWYRSRFSRYSPEWRITASVGPHNQRRALGGHGSVQLPRRRPDGPSYKDGSWAWTRLVILHEVAHNLTPDPYRAPCDEVPALCRQWKKWAGDHDHALDEPGCCNGGHTRDFEAHGPEFARIFYELTYRFISPAAARALSASFRRQGVRMAVRPRKGEW